MLTMTDTMNTMDIDPTTNVLNLVESAIRRQDDLRAAADRHLREILDLRATFNEQLREAESARIDAIRAVDVGAVNRAAEVSAQQATTLAAQVATSAETLRAVVAAAAVASTQALAAALDPIQKDIADGQKDIADLRRVQYEAQGVKSNVGESRQSLGLWIAFASVLLVAIGLAIALIGRT